MNIDLTRVQKQSFLRDGYVVINDVLDSHTVDLARERIKPLFYGEFASGLQPDEWNWRGGSGANDVTRQICNAWKADPTLASILLRMDVGRACAQLRKWPGARLNQDNVIWKPPGARALGFHQDDSYQDWIVPNEMMSCWFALDDTHSDAGTIEYVRGSHSWPLSPPISQFHAPDDPMADMLNAARAAGVEAPDIVGIEISAGSAILHHGRTWHGSRANCGSRERRSLVSHCMSSAARFHSHNVSPIYNRYKRAGSTQMDESFFPILWCENGYRTPWLT